MVCEYVKINIYIYIIMNGICMFMHVFAYRDFAKKLGGCWGYLRNPMKFVRIDVFICFSHRSS